MVLFQLLSEIIISPLQPSHYISLKNRRMIHVSHTSHTQLTYVQGLQSLNFSFH